MSGPPSHEFDPQQNQIISRLARDMSWVAAPLMVIGVLYGLAVATNLIQVFGRPETILPVLMLALAAFFHLILGVWLNRAAKGFQSIALSTGQDFTHLMEALDNLRKLFGLLSLFVKVYVALVLVALAVMIVMAMVALVNS